MCFDQSDIASCIPDMCRLERPSRKQICINNKNIEEDDDGNGDDNGNGNDNDNNNEYTDNNSSNINNR